MVPPADSFATAGAQSGDVALEPPGLDDLAREALENNPVAVRRFLEALTPTVRRVCRLVMGREHPDLEDSVQDCLINTLHALPRFRFESSVAHYVTRICTRVAIATRQRTALRSGRFPALDDPKGATVAATSADQVHGETYRSEEAEVVRRIVRDLSAVQAEAIVLRVLLGFSIEEIASITGVPSNTVKTRLRLAKDFLRRRLEMHGRAPSSDTESAP